MVRGAGGLWDQPACGTMAPEPLSAPPGEESGSKKSLVYHLSDGIYGAFSCVLFDSPCPKPLLHKVRICSGLRTAQQGPQRCQTRWQEPGSASGLGKAVWGGKLGSTDAVWPPVSQRTFGKGENHPSKP